MAVVFWLDRNRVPDPRQSDRDGLVALGGRIDPVTTPTALREVSA